MNANNRFMNYTIANIRVSLPDACTGEHFTRALRPFLTLGAGPADLALEIVPRIPAEADYRELDIFEFPDADADCRFGTDAAGYLLEMTPRDGSAPARYRMAYGAAAARSDITPGHNPALFRFGVWILFNIAALPLGAVAFHSSVISYRGRATPSTNTVAPPTSTCTGADGKKPMPSSAVVGMICLRVEECSRMMSKHSSRRLSSRPTRMVTLPALRKPPVVASLVMEKPAFIRLLITSCASS